jgi:hypothetical protein
MKGAQVKIEGTFLNLVAMVLNLEAGTGLNMLLMTMMPVFLEFCIIFLHHSARLRKQCTFILSCHCQFGVESASAIIMTSEKGSP